MKTEQHQQVFRLSMDLLDAVDLEELEETRNAMIEMNIFHAPYPEFAIEVSRDFVWNLCEKIWPDFNGGDSWRFGLFIVYNENEANEAIYHGPVYALRDNKVHNMHDVVSEMVLKGQITEKDSEKNKLWIRSVSGILFTMLIIFLATKNTEKEQFLNKAILKGKTNKTNEHKRNFPITTTLRIGKITETVGTEGGGGWKVRPHLRRGHIRSQAYGPNREMHKQIFIAPIFVHADEGWIAERKAYNVSVIHGGLQKQTGGNHASAL